MNEPVFGIASPIAQFHASYAALYWKQAGLFTAYGRRYLRLAASHAILLLWS